MTAIMALACGLAVANLYYAQPVLEPLARSFGVSEGSATVIVTVTQIGYTLGLLFLMPLGDLLEVRKLTPWMLVVCAAALVLAGIAKAEGAFLGAALVVGATATVAQVLVPFSAHLAPEEAQGRVVGRVMSGLLIGILMARTVSAEAAAALGWRAIFLISAALMLVMAGVLWRLLPAREPGHDAGYISLLASVISLGRRLELLRRRAVCQALLFLAFSAFWSTVAYQLIDRHGFNQAEVGLFALVGATGACVAPVAGSLADRGHGRLTGGVALVIAILAMLTAGIGGGSVLLLGLAGVLLDVGVTGHQITSQREVYSLVPDARSRVNTVYMGTMFVGGALGSVLSGPLRASHGWGGVMVLATASCAASFVIWAAAEVLMGRPVSA